MSNPPHTLHLMRPLEVTHFCKTATLPFFPEHVTYQF